jgi:hypothetical protein
MEKKSSPRPLYDTFTFGGNLVQRWKNYGLQPTYNADTQSLSFEFPEGWTDTMSEETRARTVSDWCIDEPTYNVKYTLTLGDALYTVRFTERDNDNLEFIANMKGLLDVTGKETLRLRFTAHACDKTLALIEGEIDLKQKLRQLGDGENAGYLFNVGHGFALFVHFADEKQISSVVFLGKFEKFCYKVSKTRGLRPIFFRCVRFRLNF